MFLRVTLAKPSQKMKQIIFDIFYHSLDNTEPIIDNIRR